MHAFNLPDSQMAAFSRSCQRRPRETLLRVRLLSCQALAVLAFVAVLQATVGLPPVSLLHGTSFTGGSLRKSLRSEPQAVLLSRGDLGSRLYAMCAATALSRAAGLRLRVVWTSDRWLPATPWADLFSIPGLDVVEDLERTFRLEAGWGPWGRRAAECPYPNGGGNNAHQLTVPDGLHVGPEMSACQLQQAEQLLAGCQLAQEVRACYQQLQPSAGVQELLRGVNLTRAAQSYGVLLQGGRPQQVPPLQLAACLLPSAGGSGRVLQLDSQAAGEAAGREPLPDWPQLARKCWGPSAHWGLQTNLSTRAVVMTLLREPSAELVVGGSPALAVQGLLDALHPQRAPPLRLELAGPGQQEVCHGGGVEAGAGPPFSEEQAWAQGAEREPLAACMRHQAAELLLLAHTKSLIHGFPSGAADFISAKAELHLGDRFERQGALCTRAPIPLLTRQRWAEQLYVNEERGVLYCSIPKVACTTWRLWMRRLQGLPDLPPSAVHSVHDQAVSGLSILAHKFSEGEAARLLTNPRLFKFVFVRNPWSRLLSAYLDKHVNGGHQRDRHLWNRLLFGRLPGATLPRSGTDPSLSFRNFLHLTAQVLHLQRTTAEPHIAPQADLCGLHGIKYDFVGRFENMARDSEAVLAHVRRSGLQTALPMEGRHFNPTNSSAQLSKWYITDLAKDVEHAYFMDVKIPLNNISFSYHITMVE